MDKGLGWMVVVVKGIGSNMRGTGGRQVMGNRSVDKYLDVQYFEGGGYGEDRG